jgi:hypothetical protein
LLRKPGESSAGEKHGIEESVIPSIDQRRLAEGVIQNREQVGADPRIGDHEHQGDAALLGESRSRGFEAFLGVNEIVEPDVRKSGQTGHRVQRSENDQIEPERGAFQEQTRIIVVQRYPRIVVGVGRMVFPTEFQNHRVDLDHVDLRHSRIEQGGNVIAGARAQDQRPLRRAIEMIDMVTVTLPDVFQTNMRTGGV